MSRNKIACGVLALMLAGAMCAHGANTNILSGVSPSSAPQGTNGLLVTFTLSPSPPPPPPTVTVSSLTMGDLSGTSLAHPFSNTVTALFNIPTNESTGAKDVLITFQGNVVGFKSGGFSVTAGPLAANFSAVPMSGTVPLAVTFSDASSGVVSNRLWNFGDGGTSTNTNPSHTYTNVGSFSVSLTVTGTGGSSSITKTNFITTSAATNGPWRFAVFSDTHVTNDVGVLPEFASAVVAEGVKFVICSGDIADGGLGATSAELQNELLIWRNAMGPVYSNGIGVYVVRGNHEDDVPNGLAAWTNVFSGAYAMPGNGPAGESNLTYSFTYNNALFLGFDEYVDLHQVNQAWLDQKLASNTLPHVFPFGHEAAFKVFHGDCLGSIPTNRNAFWSSIASAGARVYFCGHDHFFDMARIDDGDGNSSNDVYQCEVGTSGGWFMAQYNYNGTNAPYSPVNVYHETNNYGYVLVEVSGAANTNLDVTMTWKRRTYDTNTLSYVFLATTSVVSYTAKSVAPTNYGFVGTYLIADTGQTNCYNDSTVMTAPAAGQPYFGQDAQIFGNQPAYRNNGDGTISDLNTGLMWVQARGTQQVAWAIAVANASNCTVGGYSDWRMPTMKELYSLVKFSGANGTSMTNSAGCIPFLDTNYFGFAYGGTSTNVGSRIIDAQDWSANYYVSTVMGGQAAAFGYNFTDGRIKGYPPANGNYVRYVRGNANYGVNNFTNNGDGTITDFATGLMWPQNDSGAPMNWSNALAWVQSCSATNFLGHNDWRLPNAKELHSILDYTRSPATTASAAIFTNFNCTAITNEASQPDFPWYWTGTTLLDGPNSASGVYICFGRAMAYMGGWVDAHGAGAERSDPKGGSLTNNPKYTYVYNGYYAANAPQGDAVRILNFVRPVRGGFASGLDSVGDGIPDWWRRQFFGGAGTTTNSISCATSDTDGDGMTTLQEYLADTNPTNSASRLAIIGIASQTNGTQLAWIGGTGVTQVIESRRDLSGTNDTWTAIATNRPPTLITNSTAQPVASATNLFYRIKTWR